MKSNLQNILSNLQLSDKESALYLASLSLGPATPYRLAKRSGLKRPTAYVIAEELVVKGLFTVIKGEKQREYQALSPDIYIKSLKSRLKQAEESLPELMSLMKKSGDKPNVLYYEGLEGLKSAYDYRLEEFRGVEITGYFVRMKEVDEEMNREVFLPWNEKKAEIGINVRGFTVDDPALTDYTKFFKSSNTGKIVAKFLPESVYSADSSMEIFPWGVRIVIMKSKQAIIIESYAFAETMKQVFELLWLKTKGEYDKPERLEL